MTLQDVHTRLQKWAPTPIADALGAEPDLQRGLTAEILLDSAQDPDLYCDRWRVPLGGE